MKLTSTSRRRLQRGSLFVEMSFIFTVFFCMLIGAFDFGQFLFIHNALVERARYASRWGAAACAAADSGSTYDCTTATGRTNVQNAVRNVVLYYNSSVPTDGTRPYFGLTSAMVTPTISGTGTDDGRLTLAIQNYPYIMVSPYIAGTHYGPNISVSVPLGPI